MPNEIYHKSNWGNANAGEFGDVYFDAAATNKLYNHSDYYENSNGTDKILRDLSNKASIVLTPTAYSNGSLNTVIPPYGLGSELVTNGSFDTDSDWSATNSTISISNGVCQVNPTAIFGYLNSTSSFQTGIGKKYVYTFYCISRTGSGNVYMQIGTSQNGSNVTNQNLGNIEDNTSYSITFTATSTTSYLRIGFGGSGTSATIDNVSVKEVQEADFDFSRGSSATRVNEKGLIESIASGLPRIDYTSGFGSLLLEPSRTNLNTYSEDLTNRWSTSAATVTADTQISPDDSQTADTITVTQNGGGIYSNDITVTASTSYTFSFYVKRGTVPDDETALAVRNQTAGAFISLDISYSANTDNWTRIEYTFTTPVGCTSVRLYPQRLGSGGQGTIFLWGCQLEAGSYATSYIPTSGSTVTRSADVANNSGNADLINSTEGVLYGNIATLANDGTYRGISVSDGTLDNRVTFYFRPEANFINFRVRTDITGTPTDSINNIITAPNSLEFNKVALKYKQNDFAIWLNGIKLVTDTFGDVFTVGTLTKVNFDRSDGVDDFYGKTKELAVFKEALTDAELESLTSWVSFTEMATDLNLTIK